jgi:hypothetical protein
VDEQWDGQPELVAVEGSVWFADHHAVEASMRVA